MLGHLRHRRYYQERVVERDLGGMTNCMFSRAVIDVINAEYVGDEKAIKFSFFQDLGELAPVFQICIGRVTISRMSPQSRRLMTDAVHVEGVETNFFAHKMFRSRRSEVVGPR